MNSPELHLHPTVLCVDDEPIGLMVRAKLLEMAEFSVITSADGQSALEVFRTHHIDIVLLDYMMPRMHGGEVARAMRAIDPKKPIIILSAYPNLPEEVTCTADLCLVKGLPPQELIGSIRRLLAQGSTEVAI